MRYRFSDQKFAFRRKNRNGYTGWEWCVFTPRGRLVDEGWCCRRDDANKKAAEALNHWVQAGGYL